MMGNCWKRSMNCRHLTLIFLVTFLVQLLSTSSFQLIPQFILNKRFYESARGASSNTTQMKTTDRPISVTMDLMIGLKCIVQIIFSPVAGIVIDYTFPLIFIAIGVIANAVSQLLMGLGEDNVSFFLCQGFLGLGTATTFTGCYTAIFEIYKKTDSRRRSVALLNIAVSLGTVIGPLCSGLVFELAGRLITFLLPFIISGMSLLLIITLLPFCRLRYKASARTDTDNLFNANECEEETGFSGEIQREIRPNSSGNGTVEKPTPICKLWLDPYMWLITFGLFITSIPTESWISTLPPWLIDTLGSANWQVAIVWLPGSLIFIIGSGISLLISHYFGRYMYITALVAFLSSAVSIPSISLVSWTYMMLLIGVVNFNNAIIKITLIPMMPAIIDERYSKFYGSMSSFWPIAFSLATLFGAYVAPLLRNLVGFTYMNFIIGSLFIVYSPLILFLRKFC